LRKIFGRPSQGNSLEGFKRFQNIVNQIEDEDLKEKTQKTNGRSFALPRLTIKI
jgi:hypothetical protein